MVVAQSLDRLSACPQLSAINETHHRGRRNGIFGATTMDGSIILQAMWVAIHLIGLAAAFMVRQEASGYRRRLAHSGFFTCLPLIALITIVGQLLCLTTWPLSAATLGAMIVTAVVDLDGNSKPRAGV